MDVSWLLRTAAYVELNPVKASLVNHAWDYRWSSVHAHLAGIDSEEKKGVSHCIVQPLLANCND